MIREARDELEADFQREYQIDLCDLWRGTLSPRKAAVFASQLSPGSAVWQAVHSPLAWRPEARLLHSLEHHMRINVWAKTKDGQDGRNQPEPRPVPEDELIREFRDKRVEIMARRFKERQQDTST